ncbi:hypothetical protein [Hymenobacter chitinivorans]|uniref:Uncharacterized protein n=1 Tax=Hymenobacter chitinivorans DSM 11115 TaxID=1121954 RepID=A0A2M9BNC6_9BACT|nr:hypothetical protein [Hymenobacter chitinivorans]PJJ59436.1 hypothetical protein CLV45_0853 [Hymenobacter chitinivorans DSM 11115]
MSTPQLPSVPGLSLPTSTAVERIYAAAIEEAEGTGPGLSALSPADKLRNQQMEAAYALLLNYHTFDQAWPLLAKQFGLSRATCYRRLADAQNMMGDLKKVKKQGARALLISHAQMLKQLCLTQRPPDVRGALAAAKFEAHLMGLHRTDTGYEDAGGNGNTSYTINLTVQGARGPKTHAIDIGKLDAIEDAQYELLQEAVNSNVLGVEQMENLMRGEEAHPDDDH